MYVAFKRLIQSLINYYKLACPCWGCSSQRGKTKWCGNWCVLPTQVHVLASIPGRVFAFITVRRTTGPGTSCLRMRQIFIVYLWSAKIFNKSIIEICTQKMHRVSTQKMHIGSCFTKAWGVASCAAAQLQ